VSRYTVCTHPGCRAGCRELASALKQQARRLELEVAVEPTLTVCRSRCRQGPYVGMPQLGLFYAGVQPEEAAELLNETSLQGRMLFHRLYVTPRVVTDSRLVWDKEDEVLVLMEADCCLVEAVTYLLDFHAAVSCGKCFPCRLGVPRLHALLHRFMAGGATESELAELETLAELLARDTYCDFGPKITAPLRLALEQGRAVFQRHREDGCPPGEVHLFRPQEGGS
jgi:(2Fe-2S) ferredoxin